MVDWMVPPHNSRPKAATETVYGGGCERKHRKCRLKTGIQDN